MLEIIKQMLPVEPSAPAVSPTRGRDDAADGESFERLMDTAETAVDETDAAEPRADESLELGGGWPTARDDRPADDEAPVESMVADPIADGEPPADSETSMVGPGPDSADETDARTTGGTGDQPGGDAPLPQGGQVFDGLAATSSQAMLDALGGRSAMAYGASADGESATVAFGTAQAGVMSAATMEPLEESVEQAVVDTEIPTPIGVPATPSGVDLAPENSADALPVHQPSVEGGDRVDPGVVESVDARMEATANAAPAPVDHARTPSATDTNDVTDTTVQAQAAVVSTGEPPVKTHEGETARRDTMAPSPRTVAAQSAGSGRPEASVSQAPMPSTDATEPSGDSAPIAGIEMDAAIAGQGRQTAGSPGFNETTEAVGVEAPVDEAAGIDVDELAVRTVRWQRLGVLSANHSARIRLTPPELGSVEVSIRTSQGAVRVQFTVQSESVQRLLQSNSERLTESLQAHGLRAAGVEVQVRTPADSAPDSETDGDRGGGREHSGARDGDGQQGGRQGEDDRRSFEQDMNEQWNATG